MARSRLSNNKFHQTNAIFKVFINIINVKVTKHNGKTCIDVQPNSDFIRARFSVSFIIKSYSSQKFNVQQVYRNQGCFQDRSLYKKCQQYQRYQNKKTNDSYKLSIAYSGIFFIFFALVIFLIGLNIRKQNYIKHQTLKILSNLLHQQHSLYQPQVNIVLKQLEMVNVAFFYPSVIPSISKVINFGLKDPSKKELQKIFYHVLTSFGVKFKEILLCQIVKELGLQQEKKTLSFFQKIFLTQTQVYNLELVQKKYISLFYLHKNQDDIGNILPNRQCTKQARNKPICVKIKLDVIARQGDMAIILILYTILYTKNTSLFHLHANILPHRKCIKQGQEQANVRENCMRLLVKEIWRQS